MKKIIISILALVILVLLCGCGASNKLTVSYEDGSTKHMSVKKLINLQTTNERSFETIKTVSGKGKILDIKQFEAESYNGYDSYYLSLELDNGSTLHIYISEEKIAQLEGKTRPQEGSGGKDELLSSTWEYISDYFSGFYNGDTITFKNADFTVYNEKLVISCFPDNVKNEQ